VSVPGRRACAASVRTAAVLFSLGFLLAACTGNVTLPLGPQTPTSFAPPPSSAQPPPTPASGPSSSEAALKKLCPPSHPNSPPPAQQQEGGTPAAIAKIEHEVESVRGLRFEHPVPVEAVTPQQMSERVRSSLTHSLPRAFLARTSQAWETIGAIPQGTDLRTALLKFLSGQVIGFYQPRTGQLVYEGTNDPTPIQQITLAHELTHAIDDQHFDLTRVDAIQNTCHDDAGEAALSTIEGNAQFFAFEVARRYLSLTDLGGLLNQPAPSLAGVPPFVVSQEVFPYVAGLAFITAIDQRGGTAAVNHAIQHLPTSTEQIIHPDRYPNDQPQAVNVPDLAPKLGRGWKDLDAEQIGEEWLSDLLSLRQQQSTAASEAAGWDGGTERSWTDGSHTAAVLSTVWDTPQDATEFASGMRGWLAEGPGQAASVEQPAPEEVRVLFASDPGALTRLTGAVSSPSG